MLNSVRISKWYSCILFIQCLISISNASIFKEDEHPIPERIDIVVPPEGMKIIEENHLLIRKYPHLTSTLTPSIQTKEEYLIAKKYITNSQQIFRIYDYTATKLELKRQGLKMLEHNLGYITHLSCYVEHLENCSFPKVIGDATEEEGLRTTYYKLRLEQALTLLKLVMACPDEFSKRKYVDEFHKIKSILKAHPSCFKELKSSLQMFTEHLPGLASSLNPLASNTHVSRTKDKKINIARLRLQDINMQRKVLSLTEQYLSPELLKEDHDMYFASKIRELLNEMNIVNLSKDPEQAVTGYLKIARDYLALEQDTYKFMVKMKNESSIDTTLNKEIMAQLYRFIHERYARIQNLLESSIMLFLYAGMSQEALEHVEVWRFLLLQDMKGGIPKPFTYFYAKILALNGDLSEWLRLEEVKRKQREKKKAAIRRKRKTAIESHLKEAEEKASLLEKEKQEEAPNASISTTLAHREKPAANLEVEYEDIYTPKKSGKKDVVVPKPKIKTRPDKVVNSSQENHAVPPETTVQNLDKGSFILSETSSPLHQYYLSRNSYNTCQKFLQGQWKSTRNELYNLFRELGCIVDEREGKGVHGKISFNHEAIFKKEGKIITVLSDFSQAVLENRMHEEFSMLTVPEWEHKWSGIIPPYFAKSILKAFEHLGVNKDSIHKKNEHK